MCYIQVIAEIRVKKALYMLCLVISQVIMWDRANTEMLNVRWRFFHFWRQIPPAEQQKLIPCSPCFATFILANKN